jgi:hypothetical protein
MTAQSDHYAHLAARLDSAALDFAIGTSWSRTVPAGDAWFSLNHWWLDLSAA